jgi:chemotaxis family two-component system response regulator PixH
MVYATTTVLVIDENTSTCLFMAHALQKAGYRVITSADEREGLAIAVRASVHCLILTAHLPTVGISGFEVCRHLRARDPHHRLAIILTGIRDTPLDHSWALRQGADRYLPKPFTEETLVQTVTEALPPHLRPLAAFPQRSATWPVPHAQQPLPAWLKLIPHRYEDPDVLTRNNPRAGAVTISDRQARRLYAAIDGRKTVEELCAIVHLDVQMVYTALQFLLALRRIRLYTAEGRPATLHYNDR